MTSLAAAARWCRTIPRQVWLARTASWVPIAVVVLVNSPKLALPAWYHVAVIIGVVAFILWDAFRSRVPHAVSLTGAAAAIGVGWLASTNDSSMTLTMLGAVVLITSLPGRFLLPAVVLIIGVNGLLRAELFPPPFVARGAISDAMLIVWLTLFSHLAHLGLELRRTHSELARVEVQAERDRLAERLNTLMGNSLRQVAVQTQDIRRHLDPAETVVAGHLTDVAELTQRGLQQLQQLSREPVVDSLDAEVDTANVLCRRMGVSFTAAIEDYPAAHAYPLGLLLRESLTNAFKHAVPTRCVLVTRVDDNGDTLFSFVNNGLLDDDAGKEEPTGTGQARWCAMLSPVNGSIETGPLSGNRYRVVARIPAPDRDSSHANQEKTASLKGAVHG